MSTAVLCGERRRKIAIQFKLGKPLDVPRTIHRKRGRVRVESPGAEVKHVDIEVGVVRDARCGLQVGQVIERAPRGGAFTRSFTHVASNTEAARMLDRRAARERLVQEARETEEAFAYLEGLAALDELDRAAFDSALERDPGPEVLS